MKMSVKRLALLVGSVLLCLPGASSAGNSTPRSDPYAPQVAVELTPYGIDRTDESSLCIKAGFPNIQVSDDPRRCNEVNAAWTASYSLDGDEVRLRIEGLRAPRPPSHLLAIGYTVTLSGATFEDGSSTRSVILYEFKRKPEKSEIQAILRIKLPPPPSGSAGAAQLSRLIPCQSEEPALTDPCAESVFELLKDYQEYAVRERLSSLELAAYQKALDLVPGPTLKHHARVNSRSLVSLVGLGVEGAGLSPQVTAELARMQLFDLGDWAPPGLYLDWRVLRGNVTIMQSAGAFGSAYYFATLGPILGYSFGRPPWQKEGSNSELYLEASAYAWTASSVSGGIVGLPAGVYLGTRHGKEVAGLETRIGLELSDTLSPRVVLGVMGCLFCQLDLDLKTWTTVVGVERYRQQVREATYLEAISSAVPPELDLELSFEDHDAFVPDSALQNGESARLVALLRHRDGGPARGLTLSLTCDQKSLLLGEGRLPDRLADKNEARVEIPLTGAPDLKSGRSTCTAQVLEAQGYHTARVQVVIETQQLEPAALELMPLTVLDGKSGFAGGNGDGRIQNGETLELQIGVQNTGASPAVGVSLLVSSSLLELGGLPTEVGLEELPPGRSRIARLRLEVPRDFHRDSLPLELRLKDARVGVLAVSRSEKLAVERVGSALRVSLEEVKRPTNGTTGTLALVATNEGGLAALDVEVRIGGAASGLLDRSGIPLGSLQPGQTVRRELLVQVPSSWDRESLPFELEWLEEGQVRSARALQMPVTLARPLLTLTPRMAGQNGKTIVAALGSRLPVYVEVFNKGNRPARELRITLQGEKQVGSFRFKDRKVCEIGTLEPRSQFTCDFLTQPVPRGLGEGPLPLEIVATQAEFPNVEGRFAVGMLEDDARVTVVQKEFPVQAELGFAQLGSGAEITSSKQLQDQARSRSVERPVPSRTRRPKGRAYLIGLQQYQSPRIGSVAYAAQDLTTLREYVQVTLGYPADRIKVLMDGQATGGKLRALFEEELPAVIEPDETDLFLYYVGHGLPADKTGEPFLTAWDSEPDQIRSTGYSLDVLIETLKRLKPRTATVVIDSCFSGNFDGGTLIEGMSPGFLVARAPETLPGLPPGFQLFLATSKDEVACWYPKEEHSLFTWHFLRGLQGLGDLDGDLILRAGELGQYLSTSLPPVAKEERNRSQHPVHRHGPGDEELFRFRE